MLTFCMNVQEAKVWCRWRRQRSWLCRQEEPSLGLPGPTRAMIQFMTRPLLSQL